MAPPQYGDLGKTAKDLFNKGYSKKPLLSVYCCPLQQKTHNNQLNLKPEMVNHVKNGQIKIKIKINFFKN